ncbi:acylphosphatase [Salinicoccus roseus]|uniref:acylphosphatase n=1 Tax=Salinicoccus roseus TaxID=45670 RepID=UPI003524FDDC
MKNGEWLEHLKDSIPATISGDRLSIYTIALEAWRRGLKVSFYEFKFRKKVVVRYSISDEVKEVKFAYSTGPAVSNEARRISSSKTKTKEYLESAGVPVPKGQKFIHKGNEEIIEYAGDNLDFPIVLKPTGGKMGRGVIANIRDKEELKDALIHVREKLGISNVILEEFIPGEEYRIYVLNGEVIGAMNRLPANVVGDGVNSLRKLIRIKNAEREQIPSVRGRSIKIDSEVKRNIKNYGYNLTSVPQKGERILLRKNSNISTGGDPVDATDILDEKVKEAAIKAAEAVPGLVECGVDLIVDERDGTGKVIELNTSVGLAGHLFPLEGKSRDIPSALMDYYFPGTKRITKDLYFDFIKVTEMLKAGNVHEIIMPVLPQEEIIKKSLVVTGELGKTGFMNFVGRRARYFNLDGFIEMRRDKTALIVLAGTAENIRGFQEMLTTDPPRRARMDDIREGEWQGVLETGFKVIQTVESETVAPKQKEAVAVVDERRVQKLKKTNTALKKINADLEKEKARLKKENEDLQSSKSWKVTRPLRWLSKKVAGRKS